MRTPAEIIHNETIPGWMMPQELEQLDALASSIPPGGIIVEIGSLHGRSAYCFAKANPESTVHCVDVWQGNLAMTGYINSTERFSEYVQDCPNIYPHKIDSQNPTFMLDEKIDLFFLDATHKNPSDWDYIQLWLPKIKAGGILSGHDYNSSFPDVIDNVFLLTWHGYQRLPMLPNSAIWSFRIG
jgi:predicted O-methyltransferase YrrM